MIVPDRQDFFKSICRQCCATTQNDIIVIGALYGYCRIIAKMDPIEAARMTIKMFTQTKLQGVKQDEQKKASDT